MFLLNVRSDRGVHIQDHDGPRSVSATCEVSSLGSWATRDGEPWPGSPQSAATPHGSARPWLARGRRPALIPVRAGIGGDRWTCCLVDGPRDRADVAESGRHFEIAAAASLVCPDIAGLRRRFPTRAGAMTWPMTEQSREALLYKIWAASQMVDDQGMAKQQRRQLGLGGGWTGWPTSPVRPGSRGGWPPAPTARAMRIGGHRCWPGRARAGRAAVCPPRAICESARSCSSART